MSAILEVSGIVKTFGGIRAIDGANFTLDHAGIYGLIGPNGAGKTTMFDIICGRQIPDAGSVRFHAERIDGVAPYRLAREGLARTFQECRVLPEETCLDNVLFAAQDKHIGTELLQAFTRNTRRRREAEAEARRMLKLINLDQYADSPAGALSYGQRRLLEIVSCLMSKPRILLLDEPASGINPTLLNTLHDFLKEIYAETKIIFLIVEHNMEFIMSLAQEIVVMHQGQVLMQGAPDAVQANERVIDAYLG
ncbi:ABC transporter ATP-binding protein [Acuticoccus sediminis]|uniref:ABC transporter ATP-binding protein n=1 Tax=Acuticoccus sediminis TaxID=2184697 RepID=UPI001CFD4C7A|nr:ABC transporter ATP-binding protein [Acuticoccus sediminis]